MNLGNDLSSLLLSPDDLANQFIDAQFDPGVFDVNTRDFKPYANVLDWITGRDGINIKPFPRQYQILLGLFEDACPRCSDTALLQDMWGVDPAEIMRRVVPLQHGICPSCGGTKVDFRKQGLVHDKHELVLVAGQRCLNPDFHVITFDGRSIPLSEVYDGMWLRRQDGDQVTPAIVKEVVKSRQPGYFRIWLHGIEDPVICSDEHMWPVIDNLGREDLYPAVSLKAGMRLKAHNNHAGYYEIVAVEKEHRSANMIDLEMVDHVMFQAANGLVLHNSGKTALAAMIATYITHRVLTLPKMPYEMCNLSPTTLRGTFVATSKGQASETAWQNFKDLKSTSQWFKDYEANLTEQGEKFGQEFFREMDTYIVYRNMKIALTFEAADPPRLRGRTRFLCMLDELGLFPSGDSYAYSGQENYTSLNNSLITVRVACRQAIERGEIDPMRGWMMSVSSPIAWDDPIMPLLEVGKVDTKMYCGHYASWEINPNIRKEDLKGEMLKDAKKFWRDWGASPPSAADAFIGQEEMLEAIVGDRPNAIVYELGRFGQVVAGQTYHYRIAKLLGTKAHANLFPRVLHVDAGETDNSYSFCVGYRDFERNITVGEAIVEIEPEMTANGDLVSVSFEKAFELFEQLIEPFHLKMLVADRWNSTSTLEKGRDKGLISFKHSPTLEEFKLFRSRLFNRECELPARDCDMAQKHPPIEAPVARCIQQAKTVKEVGRRLTKPNVGSDDNFRAWAGMDIAVHNNIEDLRRLWEDMKKRHGPGRKSFLAQGIEARRIRSGASVNARVGGGTSNIGVARRISRGR